MDCAVLEFTRDNIPEKFQDRSIFFYDFRSAIRLSRDETLFLAEQLAEKLNAHGEKIKVLIPLKGWSEADRRSGPLYDPEVSKAFIKRLKQLSKGFVEIREAEMHINEPSFGQLAAEVLRNVDDHQQV